MRAGAGKALYGQMQPSIVKTFSLPQILQRDPAAIGYGTDVPTRVLVKNVGGSTVFVGFASGDVQSPEGVGTDVWQLNPNDSDVLLLAPGQKLYAASAGPNGRVTVHVSEAFPFLQVG